MRHYTTLQTDTGWGVCYQNHRGEFIVVMECRTLEAAYREAAQATLDATKRAICGTLPERDVQEGNRYLRAYA